MLIPSLSPTDASPDVTWGKPTSCAGRLSATLLTGGFDKPYAVGLTGALKSQGICLNVIGSDEIDCPEFHGAINIEFLNLRGSLDAHSNFAGKAARVLAYYARLLRYALTAKPKIFHILWNNKFQVFDRTLLMLYYKALGKKIVFTAHNVNAGKRDSNDSLLNRLTLKIQYLLADHIFVHTVKMQQDLIREFSIPEHKTSVIPFGINNSVPHTNLSPAEARRRLGISQHEKTILFFGGIRPYKGLEYLVDAFERLVTKQPDCRLIIAGSLKEGAEDYWNGIQGTIERSVGRERVTRRIQFIPDEETEMYFNAADVLALPYTFVFQSGVLFLAYSFGLPVVATDVGAIRDEVLEGQTGFLCRACDSADLERALETYFNSDLFSTLDKRRREIQDYANATHSWENVGEKTRQVYSDLIGS